MSKFFGAVGRFQYDPVNDSWSWSKTMFSLYGFEPGQIIPSTAVVANHLYPEDRGRILTLFETARAATGPVAMLHRINAVDIERTVVTTVATSGDEAQLADGSPSGTIVGITTDVTADVLAAAARRAREDIDAAVISHEVVDQAKGVLMLAYGLGAKEAFGVLSWLSQRTDTKLRIIAQRILDALAQHRIAEGVFRELDEVFSDAALAVGDFETPEKSLEAILHNGSHEHARLSCRSVVNTEDVVVQLSGVIDLTTAPALTADLNRAAKHGGVLPLTIDLAEVEYLASAGVSELHRFRARVARTGRVVQFSNAGHLPQLRILEDEPA
jgi:anti-anti-sigma factor